MFFETVEGVGKVEDGAVDLQNKQERTPIVGEMEPGLAYGPKWWDEVTRQFRLARTPPVRGGENVASYQCAPILLLPNVFSSGFFRTTKNLAPQFNLLLNRIAQDGQFLHETLGGEGGVTGNDDFTRILLDMHRDIYMCTGTHDHIDDNHAHNHNAKEGIFARTADRLGIRTIVATYGGQPIHNQYLGFLLRMKFSNVNKGGVASG